MRVAYASESRLLRASDGTIHCRTGEDAYTSGRYAPFLGPFDEVMVFARVFDREPDRPAPVTGPGVTVFPVPPYERGPGLVVHGPRVLRAAWRAARMSDAAFCRVPGVMGGLLGRACHARGLPWAVQVVGDPLPVLSAHAGGRVLGPLAAADMRWSCAHATAATYVTRASLQERYPPGPGVEAVACSDLALGPEAFVPAARAWDGGTLRVVAVGKMEEPYKGFDLLVEATALLVARGVDVAVRVVGEGRLRGSYERLAVDRGVADRVVFVGNVAAGAGVREELDRADLFAMPSRTEGLPRALLEAMARGLPAVASRVGGIPELLEEDVLVPSEDAAALAAKIAEIADVDRLADLGNWNLAVARDYGQDALEPIRRGFAASLADQARSRRGGARGR